MIKVQGIKKQYNNVLALDIPAMEIAAGESFGLIGNNGAGKTTFFRLILDLLAATSGAIMSKDIPVSRSEAWKKYTGSYLDEGFLIEYLSPAEYFDFIGYLHGMNASDNISFFNSLDGFATGELWENRKPIRTLSQGNKSKVGIMAALMGNPQIVVLDEPFAHLDPSSQISLKRLLKRISAEQHVTLLVSSHDLAHVTEVCNRIVLLESGLVIRDFATTTDTLRELETYFTR
ncbi:MAG: ABC transporter ATP-binding protein [Bacteroidetes bacterium]|nr:ABC transporter ATP-binding protein [Bacteroidota bacterium]